ncbi:MAG: hypothetical protein RR626_02430 [Anaerovoracaceae bacterium]
MKKKNILILTGGLVIALGTVVAFAANNTDNPSYTSPEMAQFLIDYPDTAKYWPNEYGYVPWPEKYFPKEETEQLRESIKIKE